MSRTVPIGSGTSGNKTQRYKLAVDASLNAMGSPYKALVAFTDVVEDAEDGQEYTEAKMNGLPEAATGVMPKGPEWHLVRHGSPKWAFSFSLG